MARRPAVHERVTSRKVPQTPDPYPHAVRVCDPAQMLFVSGQIPWEAPRGTVFTGAIKRQAELALTHLKNVVLDAGFIMDEVVRCTVYLTDIKNIDVVNDVYQKMFVGQALPARVVIQVAGLAKNVGIEVDCIAIKKAPPAAAEPPPNGERAPQG